MIRELIPLLKILNSSRKTIAITVFLFVVGISNVYVVSLTGNVTGGFSQTIVDRNTNEFKRVLLLSVAVVLGSAVLGKEVQCETSQNRTLSEIISPFFFFPLASCSLFLTDSTIKFLIEALAWRWRRSLCLHIHETYFLNTLYYKLVSLDQSIDNP